MRGGRRLDVDIREKKDSIIMLISGELDCSEELLCRKAIEAAPRDPRKRFVIDLGGVTFMDSTGLKLLLWADRSARVQGLRRPLIRGVPPHVMRVFNTAGVTSMLDIERRDACAPGVGPRLAEHPSHWGRQMVTD